MCNEIIYFGINQDITIENLYDPAYIQLLDQQFLEYLSTQNQSLYKILIQLRSSSIESIENFCQSVEYSDFLISTSAILEEYIIQLFHIQESYLQLQNSYKNLANIPLIRRNFIQKTVSKKYKKIDVENLDYKTIEKEIRHIIYIILNIEEVNINDLTLADTIAILLQNQEKHQKYLEVFEVFIAILLYSDEYYQYRKDSALLFIPAKIDELKLIKTLIKNEEHYQAHHYEKKDLRPRTDFKLTNKSLNQEQLLKETAYCIYCHKQKKDSCRIGLKDKNQNIMQTRGEVDLTGCPLDQRISESHYSKNDNHHIAPLAIITIDNPLVAATGDRICNDCMKACIYQKQTAVNIPKIESKILEDVLNLPWGFEIYSLLTKWNPLNLKRPCIKASSGYKVAVVGMGPAGFTLSHHLLQEGHVVIAFEGQRIEKIDRSIYAIKDITSELYQSLDDRLIEGFGGVMEYGITVRWNKNYLKIIRLLLERNHNFNLYSGIRFGSQITETNLFESFNVNHLCLAIGAGKPNILHNIPNNLCKGVRMASDFLMALQLTGAYKQDSLANLQIRMPILIIGGGLTAIDTATEALIYYIRQVEKIAHRYQIINKTHGSNYVESLLNEEDQEILYEFLAHAKLFQTEKENAKIESRKPNFIDLINELGGVKIIYRKNMTDSPAYRLNHEELANALEESISFLDNIIPIEINLDQHKHVASLKAKHNTHQNSFNIPAKTILVAIGTTPNTTPAMDDGNEFEVINEFFKLIPQKTQGQDQEKPLILTKIRDDEKSISIFGDLHPNFHGSVVKAMASAKHGYHIINQQLAKQNTSDISTMNHELSIIQENLLTTLYDKQKISDNALRITIKSKLCALRAEVGHIFRLQNYHNDHIATEPMAFTATNIDKENGLISGAMVLTGGSTSLIDQMLIGDELILMGPVGEKTEIKPNENVILIGNERGNIPLSQIAGKMSELNCNVILFVGYNQIKSIGELKNLQKNSSKLIIAVKKIDSDHIDKIENLYEGSVISALQDSIIKNEFGLQNYIKEIGKIDRVFTIGNHKMMQQIHTQCEEILGEYLQENKIILANLNSPMQCMMKGICSQCLQKIKKKDGKEEYIYSCMQPDQKTEEIDFQFLNSRLSQNSLQEIITKQWIKIKY